MYRSLLYCLLFLLVLIISPVCAEVDHQDGLQFALRATTQLHPLINSRLDSLRALGFDLEAAKANRFPTLAVQAETMSDNDPLIVTRIQQPLWVGGRIDGTIEKAERLKQTGKLSLLEIQRELMEETAVTYATLNGLRRSSQAAELNVEEHQKLLDLITRRETGRIASQADVHLANSRLAQALAQVEQIKGQLQSALAALESLTQKKVLGKKPVPTELLFLPEKNQIEDMVVANSATLGLRSTEVDLARTEVKLSKAEMMPSLYVRVDQDLYREDADGSQDLETNAGLVIEGNLEGAGLFAWRKVQSYKVKVEAAQREVDAARNEIRRKVQTLSADLDSQQKILQVNKMLVSATSDTLESFMRQYEAGRKSWVDVLNAQREFATARLALEQTVSSRQQTVLRLAVEMGLLDNQAGISQ